MRVIVHTYWDLIRGAKKWLAITLGLFCLAFAATVVVGFAKPSLIEGMMDKLQGGTETGFPAFIVIVKHNLMLMLGTWCGSLVLAVTPVWNTLGMGSLCGGLLVDDGFTYSFFGTFPHGIIEVPTILLSNAFFLKFGLRWAFQKGTTARKRAFVTDFRDSLRIFLLCAVLLCVAATIETFATPKILTAYKKKFLAGIGVQLANPEHRLMIDHVSPAGPASKAGLSAGLLIQRIDGSPTTGKSVEQCDDLIHGRAGTEVRLEVIDATHCKTNVVKLAREPEP
jgi:uncharacterized membrane protein SpoIIM required for sporulation